MELDGHLAYLRAIVDNLNDMIWVLNVMPDNTYQIAYTNPAALKSVGRENDLVGKQVAEVTTPENYHIVEPLYRQVKEERQIIEKEVHIKAPSGDKHFVIKCVPVLNAVGDCLQIITIGRELKD